MPRLERLIDIEWTRRLALPALDRVLGVPPAFVVIADRRSVGVVVDRVGPPPGRRRPRSQGDISGGAAPEGA